MFASCIMHLLSVNPILVAVAAGKKRKSWSVLMWFPKKLHQPLCCCHISTAALSCTVCYKEKLFFSGWNCWTRNRLLRAKETLSIILLSWHLSRLCESCYCTGIFQRLKCRYTTLVLTCKTVLLFLDSEVERADDGKGREPYLAWNWKLADLMENEEMYKEVWIS